MVMCQFYDEQQEKFCFEYSRHFFYCFMIFNFFFTFGIVWSSFFLFNVFTCVSHILISCLFFYIIKITGLGFFKIYPVYHVSIDILSITIPFFQY